MPDRHELPFGPFRLDVRDERLWQGDRVVDLRPKTLAVLRVLLENSGRLVTKDALLERVWPGLVVGEDALTGCLREIRQALNDDPRRPRYVETVHRRGYRFIAPVAVPPEVPIAGAAMVGRERELDRLRTLLADVARGRRRIVFVTGDAGLGKTTLIDAFLAHASARGDPWVARGECIDHYGEGEPYLPVLAALGRLCRGPEGGRFAQLLARHAPTWAAQLPAIAASRDDTVESRAAYVTPERMLREMAEALEAITTEHPVVLVLEDLHWSDYVTLDLLAYLGRRPEPARLLVVVTYRPLDVVAAGHPLGRVAHDLALRRHSEAIALGLLAEGDVAVYLGRRLGVAAGARLDRLVAAIHRRTEGHPLFLTAVVDALERRALIAEEDQAIDAAVAAVEHDVPDSLRQLIEHQVERLGDAHRRLLEVASVVGQTCSAAAVAAGAEEPIDSVERLASELARGPFLVGDGVETWPNGTVAGRYAFRHALYRQAFYDRLPPALAVQLHRRIGERTEAAYGVRSVERAAELALHFERGRDDARAAWYHEQAARTAMQRWAYKDAVGHLTTAVEALRRTADAPARVPKEVALLTLLGQASIVTKGNAAREVSDIYERARLLCGQLGDTPQRFEVLHGLRRFYLGRNEHATALEIAEEFLSLAHGRPDDTAQLLEAHFGVGISHFFLGDLAAADGHLRVGCERIDERPDLAYIARYGQDSVLLSVSYSALALRLKGFADRARAWDRRALARAEQHPHALTRVHALIVSACLAQSLQDAVATDHHAGTAIALAREHGFPYWDAIGAILLGWATTAHGRGDEGLALMRDGLDRLQSITNSRRSFPFMLAALVDGYLRSGRADEGLATVGDTIGSERNPYYPELLRLRGELLLREDGATSPSRRAHRAPGDEKAEACFREAVDTAHQRQAKGLELRAAMSLARLRQRQGKRREAGALLADVYAWFTEGFDTPDLRDAAALLAELKH